MMSRDNSGRQTGSSIPSDQRPCGEVVLFSSLHKDLPEKFNDAVASKQLVLAVGSYNKRTPLIDLSSVAKAG